MKKLFPLVTLLLGVLQFNCGKDGPVGPQGETGPQGPAGASGPAGPAGSANVVYSAWFLTGSGWDTTATIASGYGAQALYDKGAESVTQDVLDNGVVLAYMKGDPTTGISDQVFPLPYTVGVGFGFTDLWDFVVNAPGNIRFLYKSNPRDSQTLLLLGNISFRYVIIPGSIAGGRMRDPRKMSYDEVCEAYGIPK